MFSNQSATVSSTSESIWVSLSVYNSLVWPSCLRKKSIIETAALKWRQTIIKQKHQPRRDLNFITMQQQGLWRDTKWSQRTSSAFFKRNTERPLRSSCRDLNEDKTNKSYNTLRVISSTWTDNYVSFILYWSRLLIFCNNYFTVHTTYATQRREVH